MATKNDAAAAAKKGTDADVVTAKLNIYQKMNLVREQVPYLKKDATVQGYKAVTHDWVTANVRPHFIKHGIMIVPMELSSTLENTGKQTSSGIPISRFIGKYEIKFVNAADPSDFISTVITAIGEDTNDKGPGKAMSMAVKYAFLKLLSIETGDSEESRVDSLPATITVEQLDTLQGLLMDYEMAQDKNYMQRLLDFLKVETLADLGATDYGRAVNAITKAGEKRKGKTNATGKASVTGQADATVTKSKTKEAPDAQTLFPKS